MKIRIYFYLNDKHETLIASIDDVNLIPFKKGDKFWFNVSELFPKTIDKISSKYSESFVKVLIKSNKDKENFNNKRFKVISVFTALRYDNNFDDSYTLNIEYKCKILKSIYWKFWKSYKFKQTFKKLHNIF